MDVKKGKDDTTLLGSHSSDPSVSTRLPAIISIMKEMKECKSSLDPKPSAADVAAAEKAVSDIEHDLIAQLAEIAVRDQPQASERGWFVALQSMREDRARRDADMAKRPHVSLLELYNLHKHYEHIIHQAEAAIFGGGSGPVSTSQNILGPTARMINFVNLSSSYNAPAASKPQQQEPVSAPTARAATFELAAPAKETNGSAPPVAKPMSGISLAFKPSTSSELSPIQEAETLSTVAPASLVSMIEEASIDKREKFQLGDTFGGSLTWLPESVCSLEFLTHLDLSGNKLTFLPSSIGNLTNLKILDVYGNQLKELPETIGLLENLLALDFHANKLSELPTSIGGCGELIEINGNFNSLRSLPEAIGQCVNLQKISFSLNQIVHLPWTLGSLPFLRELDLHYNQLEGLPESICQLQSLEVLNIAAQHISLTEIPDDIGHLTNLVDFNMGECHVKVLPTSMTGLTNLTRLQLGGNPLQDPPIRVAEQGMEAVMEYLRKRGSGGRNSQEFEAKDTEFGSSVKGFFRRASEMGGGPIIGRGHKAGTGHQTHRTFGTSPATGSAPGGGFWGTLRPSRTYSTSGEMNPLWDRSV